MLRVIPTTIYLYISLFINILSLLKVTFFSKFGDKELNKIESICYSFIISIFILLTLWLLGVY